jgi:3-oxoacyl-[acyl-carrier-protein] synthase-3
MQLPPTVRTNDWWPAEIVAKWTPPNGSPPPLDGLSDSARAIVRKMSAQARDPFQGARQRHVLADGESLVELQTAAARIALDRAGVSATQIDLVLTCTAPVDYQLTNSACELHEALALPLECFTLQVDGAQHAFLLQLTLAESMIASGQARYALLTQASGMSRLVDPSSPLSPVFGDGATAVVIGPVSTDRGILAATHRTDGRLPNTLIASVPKGRWYDDGRAVLHLNDPIGMRDILLRTVDVSKESIETALTRAKLRPTNVDVFAMHQGMPWLRELVQEHAGLAHTRAIDTFADTAHLFGAFVPATLIAAQEQGLLADNHVVVIAGGGNGMTYGAAVLRWGR